MYYLYTFMIDKWISFCTVLMHGACPTVRQLEIEHCTCRGPGGARPVADTTPSCTVFRV